MRCPIDSSELTTRKDGKFECAQCGCEILPEAALV